MPELYEPIDPRSGGRPDEAALVNEVFVHIASLQPVFRDALIAVDVIGMTYAEAARALRTREATITSRLHRARAQVARRMEPDRQGVL